MPSKTLIIWGILTFFGLIIIFSAAFVVTETDQVIITRFGKPVGDPVTSPGINFKIPIIISTERSIFTPTMSPEVTPLSDNKEAT